VSPPLARKGSGEAGKSGGGLIGWRRRCFPRDLFEWSVLPECPPACTDRRGLGLTIVSGVVLVVVAVVGAGVVVVGLLVEVRVGVVGVVVVLVPVVLVSVVAAPQLRPAAAARPVAKPRTATKTPRTRSQLARRIATV
jgi:hypothetical protein